ncbi:hypothetical protein EJB05_36932, partial [Eragrostis curvula]
MLAAATAEAAASSRWSDLPFDLLRDISCRFHTATDYVCFHAVCKPWLDTVSPAACRPVFLPWLLMARDEFGHRTARCIFTSRSRRRCCGFATDEIQGAVGHKGDPIGTKHLSSRFNPTTAAAAAPFLVDHFHHHGGGAVAVGRTAKDLSWTLPTTTSRACSFLPIH